METDSSIRQSNHTFVQLTFPAKQCIISKEAQYTRVFPDKCGEGRWDSGCPVCA